MFNRKIILSSVAISVIAAMTSGLAAHAFVPTPIEQGHNTEIPSLLKHVSLQDDAKSFIQKLADDGIGFLENDKLSDDERAAEFQSLLQNNFDMKTIGRFALGRYWKTSTKEQQKEYLDLFEKMIVEVYSRRFNDYNGEALQVVGARDEGQSDVLVASLIVPSNGSKVSVDWRVRKKKNGQFKVVDILVEGVSMSLTQRSDFASVIQRGGGNIDVLLAHLRK